MGNIGNMNDCDLVLITGANRGLGLGFVQYYLKKGLYVVACTRDIDNSLDLNLLAKEYKSNLVIHKLDISQTTSIARLGEELEHLQFNIVINNAGVCTEENLGNWTSETFEGIFKVNTIGVALFSQTILPCIKPNGKLVNMSSGMGSIALNHNPDLGLDAYAMSKAALNIFSRRLASKKLCKNIIVVAMSPGWVKTDMGGNEAPVTIDEAILNLGIVIDKLSLKESGSFLSVDGEELPW